MLSPERGKALWEAGVNQFNISLDYLDGRHDTARGIPGLTAKIFATVSAMRSSGIDSIRFNTVIKNDTRSLFTIVERARHCCGVNFSVYTTRETTIATISSRTATSATRRVGSSCYSSSGTERVITNPHYPSRPRYVRAK